VPENFEVDIVRTDGEQRTLELGFANITIDGEPCRSSTYNDITERKQTELELQKAYTIINKSPSVAFIWKNSEGWPVEFVTANVEKLFGCTAEELKSGKVPYTQCIHPDDLERVAEEVSQFSSEKGRSDFVHKPYRIVTKEGIERFVDEETTIIRDDEGNVTHYQGILTDITDRKQAEEELMKKTEELERFNKLAVGRELKMVELKKEINALLEQLGKEPRYKIVGVS